VVLWRESQATSWSLPSWTAPGDTASWLDETSWWTGPGLVRTPQRALVEVLEAIAGRFTGRELTVSVREHDVSLRITEVRVRAREVRSAVDNPLGWLADTAGVRDLFRWSRSVTGRGKRGDGVDDASPVEAVTLEATDVVFDGAAVGDVSLHVHGMQLDPRVPFPDLVTGSLELEVRTTRARVVDWLRRIRPDWEIRGHGDGLVSVRLPRPRVRMILRPTVDTETVRVETVAVVVLGAQVRIPRRLVRTREYPIPPLGPSLGQSVELVDVAIADDDVVFRLRRDGVRQTINLDVLRAAVRDGATKLTTLFR
jgi:hypothetical protein